MIYLKKACTEDLEKEWLFVKDMPEDENGLTNAWHNVSRQDFEEKALPEMLAFSEGKMASPRCSLINRLAATAESCRPAILLARYFFSIMSCKFSSV